MAFVQSTSGTNAAAASLAVTFGSPPTVGNLCIVAIGLIGTGGVVVSTVTDNRGNTYAKAVGDPFGASSIDDVEIWSAQITSTTGTFKVTVTPSTGTPTIAVSIHEYSNVATTGALDKSAGATGTSTAPDSGATATLTHPNELIFAACCVAGAVPTTTAGTGYALRENPSIAATIELGTEDKTVSATTAQNGTFGLSGSSLWGAVVATFKLIQRETTTVGSVVDEIVGSINRETTIVRGVVDEIVGSINRETTIVGAVAEGDFPPTERYTTTIGPQVDRVASDNRETTTIGPLVDVVAGHAETSTVGAMVDGDVPSVEVYTSSVGLMVDIVSARYTTTTGALVDEIDGTTTYRETTTVGLMVDIRRDVLTTTIGAISDEIEVVNRRTTSVGLMVDIVVTSGRRRGMIAVVG